MDVFLCYDRRDEQTAIAVMKAFRERGLEVWIDLEQARSGEALRGQIADAVTAASALVWVARHDTPLSRWVSLELSWALEAGRPIHAIAPDATADLTTQVDEVHRALEAGAGRAP